jgi:hypothetical protein
MLRGVLQQRYLATSWPQIVDRIIHGPIWRLYKFGEPVTAFETERLHWALSNQIFIPAGNTLTFQAPSKTSALAKTLRPNCAIKVGITPQAATRIWEEGTGFGTTVDFPDGNPVQHLYRLQDAWNSFKDPEHRPKRGNMYVYPARGKYIHEFIQLKSDPKTADAFPAFNVSVGFQNFEEETDADPQLLPAIAEAAWKTGDPGVVFLDRVNRNVPLEHRSKYIKTLVPCGEQGMFDHETCTLGSINLNASELRNADGNFSFAKFEVAIRTAVRFLDNAVDVTQTSAHSIPSPYRRIGLGVMGWADVLEAYGTDYNTKIAADWAEELSKFMGAIARHESTRLAMARRSAFPAWYRERINMNFAIEQQDVDTLMKHGYVLEAGEVLRERARWGMRNISVTCIAPTGGINLLTGNKGFAIEPAFEDVADISTYGHLQMLNAWQSGMCNSVSKTINFPNRAEPQDFLDAILEARKLPNIKALSMYRLGSRAAQPIA